MKARQIRIIEKKDYLNHFGTFQAIVNEELLELAKDAEVSDVRIEHATETSCVISYTLFVDEDEF